MTIVLRAAWLAPRALLLVGLSVVLPGTGRSATDGDTAGLARLPGARVTLLVPRALAGREMIALGADLDRAAAEMLPRLAPALLARPAGAAASSWTVEVAPDYTAQARQAGRIGAAVRGRGASDLVVVDVPEDRFALRYALAEAILARAGIAAPPALLRGAALWAAGGWYGRPYGEWLPLLARAGALPSVPELLGEPAGAGAGDRRDGADGEPADGSEPLSTPVAAAIVERLPGATAAAKLAHPPSAAFLAAILTAIQADLARNPAARPAPAAARPRLPPFLRGVSLAMSNSLDGGYHAPGLGERLDRLRRLGVDAVSLMPFAFEEGRDSPRLAFVHRRPEGETDIGLVHAARLAHARGLRVLWKPHVWVEGDGWAGEVEMRSEADWAAWWRSYRRYVLHHAFLARWSGAEMLSVGCELSRTAGRTAEWRRLIEDVRVLYPGAVTYASNWGADLDRVTFWDALDAVGVDAYDPLAASPAATRADLARGAAAAASHLAEIARRAGRPVVLTEVGFPARRAAWAAPHLEGGDYSEADQALSYEVLFAALDHRPWLAGTFVWKTFSGDEGRFGARPDFRFLGRPAEAVIARYYGGVPPASR